MFRSTWRKPRQKGQIGDGGREELAVGAVNVYERYSSEREAIAKTTRKVQEKDCAHGWRGTWRRTRLCHKSKGQNVRRKGYWGMGGWRVWSVGATKARTFHTEVFGCKECECEMKCESKRSE